jgi:hypothetical protein
MVGATQALKQAHFKLGLRGETLFLQSSFFGWAKAYLSVANSSFETKKTGLSTELQRGFSARVCRLRSKASLARL